MVILLSQSNDSNFCHGLEALLEVSSLVSDLIRHLNIIIVMVVLVLTHHDPGYFSYGPILPPPAAVKMSSESCSNPATDHHYHQPHYRLMMLPYQSFAIM